MKTIDLAGQKFGRLTVMQLGPPSKTGASWNCVCDCGRHTIVNSLKLRNGSIVSCGCYRRERLIQASMKHGMSKTSRTYRTWKEMRNRCTNPKASNFKWYGGKGVFVCLRWQNFETFLADMGERPAGMTIDRIDNLRGYEPGNCRWATNFEQTRKQAKNKLTERLAQELRTDRKSGMSYRALGAKYGISATTAHRCVIGAIWAIS